MSSSAKRRRKLKAANAEKNASALRWYDEVIAMLQLQIATAKGEVGPPQKPQ